MNRRRFCQLALAVVSLAYQTTSLQAQTTRIRQDAEIAIPSLNGLSHAHADSGSLGRVDASSDNTVDLAVSGGIGMVNFEAAGANLAGSGSRRAALHLSSARSSQSKNKLSTTTPRAYNQLSPFVSLPSVPSSSFAYTTRHVLDRQQTSKHGRISHSGTVDFTNDTDTADAIQGAQQSSFEKLPDPFSKLFYESIEGFAKNLGMEQPCGAACSLRSPGRLNSYSSKTPRSGHSADQRYSHKQGADLEQ